MTQREDGNVTILTLMLMMSLAAVLVIALEFACVYAQKLVLDNYLNIAREETFSAGFDMQLKSAEDPVRLINEKVVGSLRDNGYDGAIEIAFYEATRAQIEQANPMIDDAENVRVLAWQANIALEHQNVVAPAAWLSEILLASTTTASMCPYSLHKTYRPQGVDGQLWQCSTAAETRKTTIQNSDGQIPAALEATLSNALKKPTEIFEANQ